MTDLATLSIDGRIARLTLNRPEKRNALSLDVLAALATEVTRLSSAEVAGSGGAPSVVVITGEGRSFCAGMDLRAVLDDPEAPLRLLSAIAELTIAMRKLPMVTVARVNGAAIGGGCGLVATADLAITHPDAKLGFPEVDLGVCPAVVAPWLVEKVGAGAARKVLLSGGTLSGLDAFNVGLVTQCVPVEQLDEATEEVAARLASAGPRALAETKRLLNELEEERGVYEAVRRGAQVSADVVRGDEAQAMLRKVYGA